MRNNSITRLIVIALLGIFGLWLIYTLLVGPGLGLGMRGYYGGGHMDMGIGIGFGYGSTLTYLLLLLIKVLFAVFVIGLVAGIIVWIKNNMFTSEDIETIKNTFTGNRVNVKERCSICNRDMEAEWKVCPHCGKEKEPIYKQTGTAEKTKKENK